MEQKDFPSNFPDDAVSILNDLSFNPDSLQIAGSSGLRSQLYAGDFDGFEIVDLYKKTDDEALDYLKPRFQKIIERLHNRNDVYIGDIKCGAIEEWRVLPDKAYTDGKNVYGYNAEESRKRFDDVPSLTSIERNRGQSLLIDDPTPVQFLEAKDFFKFHTVRWKVSDVVKGYKILRDGNQFFLQRGFESGVTKVDVIGYVENNRFTDFSVIYQFCNRGEILNPMSKHIVQSLKEDIFYYLSKGEYFKALKRKFSLLKLNKKTEEAEKLIPIFNSDLGRIYRIISDIGTLLSLLENKEAVPLRSIRIELDQFIGRLSNVYTLKDYLKEEPVILEAIRKAIRTPRQQLIPVLVNLSKLLGDVLNTYSKEYLR
jgi:hypothetical protein